MADFESVQKLALEHKCPHCLRLFNRPTLLPCNHVFCKSCIPGYTAIFPVCKARFVDRDLTHLLFMEKVLTIYKGSTDAERVSRKTPASTNIQFSDEMNEELPENAQGYNSRSGLSIDKVFGVDKNGEVENRERKRRDRGIEFSADGNQNLSSPRSRMRGGGTDDFRTCDVTQSSPHSYSPPSFGVARCSDNDSYYRCSEHSSAKSFIKRPNGENNGSREGKLRNDGFGFRKDGNFREVEKQKQLNYGAFTSKSESKLQKVQKASQPGMQEPKILDGQCANKTICAFCHSSEISEDTGEMLHYSSAKLVVGDEATLPNVIHVHKVCFDWAPQVYYVDDRVQNLKEEVARGAKLKCYACGKKGAALGCYVKSCRRSYHVPCSMKVSRCRWAYEDYLMLCPAHSSVRFPNEKSKSSKNFSKDHNKPAIVCCQLSNSVPSPDEEKKLCFCGSALSTEETILLVKFGMMNGATVSKFWNPNITHVIAATDGKGTCTRTLKFLMAILTGRWIVKVDSCMEAKCNVNEEPYEVILDNYGCCDGPRTGRLRASNNAPKLFSGLNFYFVGDFLESHKEDLQDLVTAAGGTVLKCREELVAQTSEEVAPTPRALVVYNVDRPEGCRLGAEGAILFQRLSEAEDIASQTGSEVIGLTWLLESIAGHKLQSVVS